MTPIAQATRRFNPAGLTQPTSYHHIIEHGPSGLVFLSGQIGADANGEAVGTTVGEQFSEILRHFDLILAELGLGREAFLKVQIFVTDVEAFYSGAREEFESYFVEHPPAATLVKIPGLFREEFLVEVDATLARDTPGPVAA